MCLLPIDRVVRFITAKLACARAYTSLQGYMNDEKKSPALRFASGSIFFPRPCLRLSVAHCLTAYENDDNTTERLRHKKVDHRILTRCRQRRRLKTPLTLPSRYSITLQNNMELEKLISEVCGLSLEEAKDEINSARGYLLELMKLNDLRDDDVKDTCRGLGIDPSPENVEAILRY